MELLHLHLSRWLELDILLFANLTGGVVVCHQIFMYRVFDLKEVKVVLWWALFGSCSVDSLLEIQHSCCTEVDYYVLFHTLDKVVHINGMVRYLMRAESL